MKHSSRPTVLAASASLLVLAGLTSATLAAGPGLEVTHIANAGFLVVAGDQKVIVDSAFDAGLGGYPKIPAALRPDLESATGPFAGVDLVLATHHHGDHFGPRAVARHLEANPAAIFVGTRPAVAALRAHPDAEGIATDRIRTADPGVGETVVIEHRGLRVEALHLHHGSSWESAPNLGFLIEMGGLTWLHIGDTEAGDRDLAAYDLPGREIDLAFLSAWFVSEDRWAPLVERRIRPREIIVMHLPESDAPPSYFGSAGSLERRIEKVRARFPEAIVMSAGETLEVGRTSTD